MQGHPFGQQWNAHEVLQISIDYVLLKPSTKSQRCLYDDYVMFAFMIINCLPSYPCGGRSKP